MQNSILRYAKFNSQNWVHVYILHLFWIFCSSLQFLVTIRVFFIFLLFNTNQLLTWIALVRWWIWFLTKELGIYNCPLSNYCFTDQRKVTWSGERQWGVLFCSCESELFGLQFSEGYGNWINFLDSCHVLTAVLRVGATLPSPFTKASVHSDRPKSSMAPWFPVLFTGSWCVQCKSTSLWKFMCFNFSVAARNQRLE